MQPTEVLEQLNQLSDVELPTLALIAVLGFIILFLLVALMFRSIANRQARRETEQAAREERLAKIYGDALKTLADQVDLNREAYLDAREEFRGLRDTSATSAASIVKEIVNGHDDVKAHSTTQANRAIGVVEKRIEAAEENFQSSINVLNQQLQNVNALLAALDMKVTSATATQSETKSTIEIVRSMVNDALELIRARQDAEDGLLNNGEKRLKELEVQAAPTPPTAAFKLPPTP